MTGGVDLTPGSGIAAQAFLLEGWPYLVITHTTMHTHFLQNRLDRDALSIIARAGTAVYSAGMAASIKEHFADLLNEDIGEDPELEDEDEDE